MKEHKCVLNSLYNSALREIQKSVSHNASSLLLDEVEVEMLDTIVNQSERFKGVCTVLITSLTHKIVDPQQDVRRHQSSMPGGYSGRGVDTKYITPFLKDKQLIHMEESGWLTRSLEHNSPYDFNYNGKIRDQKVKLAFLTLLDNIEKKKSQPRYYLEYLFRQLILLKDSRITQISRLDNTETPINKAIYTIEDYLKKASGSGVARLPVLAIYSVYECVMHQMQRYKDKDLLKLRSHTSADSKSGDIGDIQINYNSRPFEGIEVKYEIAITPQLIQDAYRKIHSHPVNRYYLLSTIEPSPRERKILDREIVKIAEEHGCQFIVNGLLSTLQYYLRLISSSTEFLDNYSKNLTNDAAIKSDHIELWQQLVRAV